MNKSIRELVAKRKELWYKHYDIEIDRKFRNASAEYIISKMKKDLWNELQENPEMFIELTFVVVDKEQKTIPFFLNTVQQKFIQRLNRQKRDFDEGIVHHMKFLVLKGRQQGFTTVIDAYNLASCILNSNFSGFILADNSDNTSTIFTDKIKFPYDLLPTYFKPIELYSNRKELHFQNEEGTGLNSKIRVTTAGNKDAGRSKTINFLHISEGAFVDELTHLLTGLSEALTKNVIAIIESTANGFNDFKDLWDDDNNWINLFYEWWETPEYTLDFTSTKEEKNFTRSIYNAPTKSEKETTTEEWIYSRCKWLTEKMDLTINQAFWYFDKWKDKKSTIVQEYPCTSEEAFLASGRPYFDLENVSRRLAEVKKDVDIIVRRGYFEYKYIYNELDEKKQIDNESIEFIDDLTGSIKIFKLPENTLNYSLGGDTATTGIDDNICQVLTNVGEQQAILTIDKDEDLFADQMYCLGSYYNWGMISVEVNHSTHPIKVLVERAYPNLYLRGNSPDATGLKITQNYGFRTTMANRPDILGEVRQLVRDNIDYISDVKTLKEMMTFIINDKGKPEADVGKHDDTIMSLAIALHVTTFQANSKNTNVETLSGKYFKEELEDLGYSTWEIEQYMNGEDLIRRV